MLVNRQDEAVLDYSKTAILTSFTTNKTFIINTLRLLVTKCKTKPSSTYSDYENRLTYFNFLESLQRSVIVCEHVN